MSEPWTIARVLTWMRKDFAGRGFPSPLLDAQLLLARALGLSRVELYTRYDQPLTAAELASARALVERRRSAEPVAYILGEREFYRRAFVVDRRVLVPRPETEGLVTAALAALDARSGDARGTGLRALDLGTGSGALAVTLAAERAALRVDAVDVSSEAAAVARENAVKHGVDARVRVLVGDLFAALEAAPDGEKPAGGYDVLVSNPPYISEAELPTLMEDVRAHEPRLALVGGVTGLELLERLLRAAPAHLAPGAAAFIEIGHTQGERAMELARGAGLERVSVARDFNDLPRMLCGYAPA